MCNDSNSSRDGDEGGQQDDVQWVGGVQPRNPKAVADWEQKVSRDVTLDEIRKRGRCFETFAHGDVAAADTYAVVGVIQDYWSGRENRTRGDAEFLSKAFQALGGDLGASFTRSTFNGHDGGMEGKTEAVESFARYFGERFNMPYLRLDPEPTVVDVICVPREDDGIGIYQPLVVGVDPDYWLTENRLEHLHESLGADNALPLEPLITDGGEVEPDRPAAEARAVAGYETQDKPNEANPYAPNIDELVEADADPAAEAFMGGGSAFAGGDDPEPTSPSETYLKLPESAIPLGRLRPLTHGQGMDESDYRPVPVTTEEARERLKDTIDTIMRNGSTAADVAFDGAIIDAPTSLGKSYAVASENWGARDALTGGQSVVLLSETRKARDAAAEIADNHPGSYKKVLARDEACPVCAGDYDPEDDEDEDDDSDHLEITVDGQPVSEYIEMKCSYNGYAFSTAHNWAERHNDQGVSLPCQDGQTCPAKAQWDDIRENDYGLIIGTHQFAHAPGLRNATNLVFDEQPSFALDDEPDRLQNAVEAYLQTANAAVDTWDHLMRVVRAERPVEALGSIVAQKRNADPQDLARKKGLTVPEWRDGLLRNFKKLVGAYRGGDEWETDPYRPDEDWYRTHTHAHMAAPALTKAVVQAEAGPQNRLQGSAAYEPVRPDAHTGGDMWNLERLKVVIDQNDTVSAAWSVPDVSQARTVIGLDAHPAEPVWQQEVHPNIRVESVLDPEERQVWRRRERGLTVVQVGDATRPCTSDEHYNHDRARVEIEHLREELGVGFQSAITSNAVEDRIREAMKGAGIADPATMYYGMEKSRNDFEDHDYGYVHGCIDPGDGMVMDYIAALGLDAAPERADACCGDCGDRDHPEERGDGCRECGYTGWAREKGRNFVGNDADTAEAILASVRENHVAQAVGRYARNPGTPSDGATVFVATDALPDGLADAKVPGAITTWTSTQRHILRVLRDSEGDATTGELAEKANCSKSNVRYFLNKLADKGVVSVSRGTGAYGANEYNDNNSPSNGLAEIDYGDSRKEPVPGPTYTGSLCIIRPDDPLWLDRDDDTVETAAAEDHGPSTPVDDAESEGDPPPSRPR